MSTETSHITTEYSPSGFFPCLQNWKSKTIFFLYVLSAGVLNFMKSWARICISANKTSVQIFNCKKGNYIRMHQEKENTKKEQFKKQEASGREESIAGHRSTLRKLIA